MTFNRKMPSRDPRDGEGEQAFIRCIGRVPVANGGLILSTSAATATVDITTALIDKINTKGEVFIDTYLMDA